MLSSSHRQSSYFYFLKPLPPQPRMPPPPTPLNSERGRAFLTEAATQGAAEAYWPLSEQHIPAAAPALLGASCLAACLNALRIDPNAIWKGGWRWFDARSVVSGCCRSLEQGTTLDEFAAIGRCNGTSIKLVRPHDDGIALDVFRRAVVAAAARIDPETYMAVSFSRDAMNIATPFSRDAMNIAAHLAPGISQSGEIGSFASIAGYHESSDSVLMLDSACPPYWCALSTIWAAMAPVDTETGRSRGYVLLSRKGPLSQTAGAVRNMAQLGGGAGRCPVNAIKVTYCPLSEEHRAITPPVIRPPRR